MNIEINGVAYDVESDATLADVPNILKIEDVGIAIAVNSEVIPRSRWSGYTLEESVNIMVIRASAGG